MVKLLMPIFILSITACQQDKADLSLYVAEIKARKNTAIQPLPLLKPYEKFKYSATDIHNPFIPVVVDLSDEGPEKVAIIDNGIRPDVERLKEDLEKHELAELTLVGTLEQGSIWALIRVPEGLIHRVQVGDYMGKNYGEIITISDTEVTLQEVIPDDNVGFINREQIISVQE